MSSAQCFVWKCDGGGWLPIQAVLEPGGHILNSQPSCIAWPQNMFSSCHTESYHILVLYHILLHVNIMCMFIHVIRQLWSTIYLVYAYRQMERNTLSILPCGCKEHLKLFCRLKHGVPEWTIKTSNQSVLRCFEGNREIAISKPLVSTGFPICRVLSVLYSSMSLRDNHTKHGHKFEFRESWVMKWGVEYDSTMMHWFSMVFGSLTLAPLLSRCSKFL